VRPRSQKRAAIFAAGLMGPFLLGLLAWPTAAEVAAEVTPDGAFAAICRAEQVAGNNAAPRRLTIEQGMGDGGFAIRTGSAEAQAWFDYGLKLFHAFYHDDAKLAFDKAVAADADCTMCLWGQALSHGPTQNYDVSTAELRNALAMARKAAEAAATPQERLLTAAMVRRYDRSQNGQAEIDFADDLLAADKAGPPATDLRLLASEALLTAWRRGHRNSAAPAMALAEAILKEAPDHTGAIHYYIHATEFSGQAALALPYAEKLSGLAPKASHLVHMAAHTFMRVGRYQQVAAMNAVALQVGAVHLVNTGIAGPLAAAGYYGHNLGFGMAGTQMSGDAKLALKFADHLRRAYPDRAFAGDNLSTLEGRGFAIYGRFDPRRMLEIAEPAAGRTLARALYHYGRGEAFAALRDAAGLERERDAVSGDNTLARIAKAVLSGRLAMLQGRTDEALRAFEDAAGLQERLLVRSMDPPAWWYPVRRSVAAAHLRAGDYARAAEEAKKSLEAWPNDALALLVLSKAEEGLGQAATAAEHRAAAVRSWQGKLDGVELETI
jgi:tetratricopeptide (TPR) repeat protein